MSTDRRGTSAVCVLLALHPRQAEFPAHGVEGLIGTSGRPRPLVAHDPNKLLILGTSPHDRIE